MAIRALGERDRAEVMRLLTPERTLNLFIIGDVENNGFEADFQELWGDFDAGGRLRAVLLRYYGNFIPYAPGEFDLDGLTDLISRQRHQMRVFSGIERVMSLFEGCPGLLPESARRRSLHFMELREGHRLEDPWLEVSQSDLSLRIEQATPEDVPDLVDAWREIDGAVGPDTERASRRDIEQGSSRAYLIRHGGRVVATVRTSAENSLSAMITGVVTIPGYRRLGLATRLLVRLCGELLAEGKRPCLLYDNPEAGTIYRRLGFTEVGTWVMFRLGNG